ncbi:hypothetical protein LMG26411_08167 [Cupriavidus numazuensis]|uniref:Uncharacterized protein n=1 Tax=Cupriavidus numazuensis TaxID=221992 RepID=A0ABN7QHV7_9BURK|nr:hypothetical protein LMG26411_08167 [Cupriavidus numazuensis]
MVHHHHQYMLPGSQPQQAHAQQRAGAELERRLGQLARDPPGFGLGIRSVGQIDLAELERAGLHHPLLGQAFRIGAEYRAQRLMARHDGAEALAHGRHVQLALQAQCAGDVVRAATALQFPQEPLARLRV